MKEATTRFRGVSNYLPLPTGAETHTRLSKRHARRNFPRRHWRIIAGVLLVLTLLRWYFNGADPDAIVSLTKKKLPENTNVPPLYERWHERELALPQHNPDLPLPEGRNGKYVWMANHVHGSGWGNVLQELFLNTLLAHDTDRAFVFNNYTWNRDGSDFSEYNGKQIPSRIPLSVLIKSQINGQPWAPGDKAPRSVSKEYFDTVCPQSERTIISSNVVSDAVGPEATALETLQGWIKQSNAMDARCLEIDVETMQLFNVWIFGSKRVLDIWPRLSASPIIKTFAWSALIHEAFDMNKHRFHPRGLLSYLPYIGYYFEDHLPDDRIPGLLALHIRRGDFEAHCEHLAKWSSTFNGFNQFPELQDAFVPPEAPGWGETNDENRAIYRGRCYPSPEQMADKIERVRRTPEGSGLRNVHIMTNARADWLEELKAVLKARGQWQTVTTSRDLQLTWEQRYVAQVVDMLIGQQAQVFIGNGFSSLTSNTVMLRMGKGFPSGSTRLW